MTTAAPDGIIGGLAERGAWHAPAADLLADLGFTLINGRRPGLAGSHLLVALRAAPTFRHFDPEAIGFYAPADGRGALSMIDRTTATVPPTRIALWGHVHVVDRLGIENRFLTFGGELRAAALDQALTVVDLWSPGPIVRWGGHSQGTDALAGEIGAFFGRLIVPVDCRPGAEGQIDGVPPDVLYSAFVIDLEARLAAARRHGAPPAELDTWLAAERRRLSEDSATWHAGQALLVDLALGR